MSTEDKENQSSEAHESTVKTPLKQTTTSSSFLAEIQPAASGHLTTPPKPNEVSPRDPWTPTANLKMLISAASPEIRNREQGKKLSDSRSESFEEHLSGDEYEKSQPSRKDKSLGLLCHKFLARYPRYPSPSKKNVICLDEVSELLNVERRRIYDIMNVLESLHMVSRIAKNKYSWHGYHNLKKTLQILKKVAEENKYTHQIELIKKRESEQESEEDGQKIELMAKQVRPNDHTDICFVQLPGMEFRSASINSRKDKSLRVMSQKFVMLFLVSSPQVVSLDVAAKMLIGEDHMEYLDKSKFKTKIRRLYDIANVLSSLELIEKVHSTEKGRKPAFKWTGPDIFSDIQDTQSVSTPVPTASSHSVRGKSSRENCSKNLFPARSKQGFTRHPSLIKTAKTTQSDWRKIRSAPSSPIKKNTNQIEPTFPSKMAQLAAICKQQLDEQSSDFKKMKTKLEHPTTPGPLGAPPKSYLNPKPFLLPSQAEILPLVPCSVSPAVLTPVHSNVSYAMYFQPFQTQVVTACNPSLPVHPVPCTSVIGIKSPVEASSQLIPDKKFIEDSNLEAGDTSAEDQNLELSKEQEGRKDGLISGKCFKRCKLVLEDSPTKKCKNEKKIQNEPQSLLPSGYLIPLSQFTKLLSETTVCNNRKTESCVEQNSYISPIADGIPVTSNSTAVHFPTFHLTPLNLMAPSSVAAVPVVNGSATAPTSASPAQAPSSSLLSFMLQHTRLIPPSSQVSENQVFEFALVGQREERVATVPKSVSTRQRKALQNVLPKVNNESNGKPVSTTPLKPTTGSASPSDSQKSNRSAFQMCESTVTPSFCSSSCELNEISQEELVIQQTKLDMSTEDDNV